MHVDDSSKELSIGGLDHQQMINKTIGEVFNYKNRFVILRSSKKLMVFKLKMRPYKENDVDDGINDNMIWVNTHSIPVDGRIYYMRNNHHFQVTTDDKIFVYGIDENTGGPKLESVMSNYMNLSHIKNNFFLSI